MLENFVFTGRELLLAVILASLVYLLEVWLFSRRDKGATPSDKRIKALETEIDLLKQRLQALEDMPPVGSSLDARTNTYADAQRMAREGTPALELAGSLGISRGEAELIVALQRAENQSP
jgi:Tfp pilus assembly protein PilN